LFFSTAIEAIYLDMGFRQKKGNKDIMAKGSNVDVKFLRICNKLCVMSLAIGSTAEK
jgi:hypothetical protein